MPDRLGYEWWFNIGQRAGCIREYAVYADEVRHVPTQDHFERDNYDYIWEWLDFTPTATDLAIVKAIIDSKEAYIRFEGDQYRRDYKITAADKKALADVLAAFQAL
jgi:hypothetical protein